MAKRGGLFSDDDSPGEPNPIGRFPKLPKGLAGYLDDLSKHCNAWSDRYHKVWFAGPGVIERAIGAVAHPESPEWYEYTINRLLDIIDLATEAKEKLERGKAQADRTLTKKENLAKQPDAEQSPEVPGSDEEQDDYGFEQLEEP